MRFLRLTIKRVLLTAMVLTLFLFGVKFSPKLKKALFQRVVKNNTVARKPPGTNQQQPRDTVASGVSPFPFTIEEPNICTSKPDLFALIYISTAPENSELRTGIRQMFGGTKRYGHLLTTTVFFLGKSNNSDVEQAVLRESGLYHDIIQADYADNYRNLTLKTLSALHWITRFCHHTKYLIKLDDDIFVNMFRLIPYMDDLHKKDPEDMLLHCNVFHGGIVHRKKDHKWYVSPEEYKGGDVYPDFCYGQFVIYRFPVASALLNASKMVPFLWLEDVYLTGLVAPLAGIKLDNHFMRVEDINKYDTKLIQGNTTYVHMRYNKSAALRNQYWEKVLLHENLTNF